MAVVVVMMMMMMASMTITSMNATIYDGANSGFGKQRK
jgi:hypothetical protein